MTGTHEYYEQIEFSAPEIEQRLAPGGVGEMGCDITTVVSVEVLPKEATDER